MGKGENIGYKQFSLSFIPFKNIFQDCRNGLMPIFCTTLFIQSVIFQTILNRFDTSLRAVFSSPEYEVSRVSYCDSAVSIVRRALSTFTCERSRGLIFSPIIMKLSQNVCLEKISDDFENGSYRVKN